MRNAAVFSGSFLIIDRMTLASAVLALRPWSAYSVAA